ncbi:MAG: hypothetical protein RLZZ65_312 [Bacteroidota bacterium]|jgi:gliding motility-associated-like protein
MRYLLAFVCFLLCFAPKSWAQYCIAPTSTTAITPTTSVQYTATFPAGTAPVFTFTATAGCTYTFATCGLSSVDTYLRIYNAAGALVQGWDDQCGFLQTNAVWYCSTSGPYSIQLSQFFCNYLYGPATVSYFTSCLTACTNPTVNAGIDILTCAGSTAQLAGVAAIGSGSGSSAPLTYSWSPATGLSATNILNPIATPTTTTTYTLTATQGNCTSQDQVVVTVNPTPSVSGTSQTFCPGTSVTLSAIGSPANGTYLWTPGSQNTNTITVSPTTTTTYNVQYTLGGCSSNTSITATQINGIDWANIQSPGTSTICEGQSLTVYGQVYEAGVTETSSQGAGISVQFGISTTNTNPATWPASAWSAASYNAAATSNPNNDEYAGLMSGLSPGTYYYAFSYSYNGCTVYGGFNASGGGFWNGTTNINGSLTVNANVNPTFTAISAICSGSTFPGLPLSSTNNISGTWSPAPNNLQTTTYTFTPAAGVCALTATLTVNVNPLPTLSITNVSNTTLLSCSQTSIALNAVGTGSFAWANGITPISTGNALNITAPGTYTVGLLDQNGCLSSSSITITQDIAQPVAVITTNPNTQVLTCSTTSIALIGSGGNTYSWSNGTTAIANSSTTNITAPGTYTLSVTGTNGCVDTEIINISQNITPPVASITSNIANNTLNCNTTSITLTAGGGVSYSWSNGTASLGTTNSINVTSAGTYTLTATGANGCTDTENITITSQANTIPTFNAIAPICAGTSFTLPTTSLNGVVGTWSPAPNFNTTTTYSFTPNPGLCANPISFTVIVNPYPVISAQNDTICAGATGTITTQVSINGGTYNWAPVLNNQANLSLALSFTNSYQVIYTVAGCADTANASIIVKPVPQISVQNATICAGQFATISASANLPNGAFVWSNGSTSNSQTLSPSATTNYNVVYTLDGCSSVSTFATITVLPVPSISVTNQTVCAGDPAALTASANPSGTYFWGANGVSGTSVYTFTPTQNTQIPVYNVLNGCFSDTVYAQVNVTPLPISTFTSSSSGGCVPVTVTFTADENQNTSYTWYSNGQNIGAVNPFTYIFTTAGNYNISLTSSLNGCSSSSYLSAPIIVDAYPVAAFEPSSDLFTEPNQGLSFWNNSSNALNYFWDFGDGSTSTEVAPYHQFNNNENEAIEVSLVAASQLGCLDSISYTIDFDPGLVYYIPNTFTPDGDQFNQVFKPIFTYGIDTHDYLFEVFDRWGELIFESKNPAIGWDGTYSMNGNQCQNGTYIYRITIKVPSIDDRKIIEGHLNLVR